MNGRRSYQVAVRLDRKEIMALRRQSGATDAERLRALLHQKAIADLIYEQLVSAVHAEGQETRRYVVELSHRIATALGQPRRQIS